MTDSSSMILLGVGGAGCRIAQSVRDSFGAGLRFALLDTDASSAAGTDPETFFLLGGDRLSGRGAGGDIVNARLAAEDSAASLDESLEGVRMAVIATSLGGGTGGGATLEILRHLSKRGIETLVFATTPFAFEGEQRHQNARGIMPMIEEEASASFFMPLDKLVGGSDNMKESLDNAVSTMASAATMFWRLVEKPGYIKTDPERLRHMIAESGKGRFAVASATGPDRARNVADALLSNSLLADGTAPVRSILCGVLAGDDLRLSEIAEIADSLKTAFGGGSAFDLATVNDEDVFGGGISVVAMLFESSAGSAPSRGAAPAASKAKRSRRSALAGALLKGRFKNAEPTIWNGENLDIPTYVRKNSDIGV